MRLRLLRAMVDYDGFNSVVDHEVHRAYSGILPTGIDTSQLAQRLGHMFSDRAKFYGVHHSQSWVVSIWLMLTNEAALCDLLARHQPELAPRLARRLAQLPSQHVTALLAEGAAGDLTPALREVIDVALAEELGEGGLQEVVAPLRAESTALTRGSSVRAQNAPKHTGQAVTTKEGESLLMRVASIQPEMAHDLARLIEREGEDCVARCMASELVLKQQVERALKQLFTEEEDSQEPASVFSRGRGHVLPGDVRPVERQPLVGKQGRSIKSSLQFSTALPFSVKLLGMATPNLSLLSFGLATGLAFLGHLGLTAQRHSAGRILGWFKSQSAVRADHQRFKEELQHARIHMLKGVHGVLIHLMFVFGLTIVWKWIQEPCLSSFCQVLATGWCYVVHLMSAEMIKTEGQFMKFQALCISIHILFVLGTANETDLVMFDVAEKVCTIGAIYMSISMIDVKVTLPVYVFQSALLTYCRWNLIGFAKVTLFVVSASVASNLVVGGLTALVVHHIRSDIAAKLDSGEASSLMLGFREILRGVCDGDLVLDRRSMTIVDANCLERVLKSSKTLKNTNFLDLFLDTESRDKFTQFLAAEHVSESGIPRGLRVSLQDSSGGGQGSRGAVSMDLFYTTLPAHATSSDYCLIAMKEDPEQQSSPPPDLGESSLPFPLGSGVPATKSRSSVSDLVMACDDLVEMTLRLSDATGFLDIEEVHLSFQRQSECKVDSGMPTLRKFIRPSDWDRIETMFNIVFNLPEADRQEPRHFRRPLFFRVPGESRSYLCARSASLKLADDDVHVEHMESGMPTHFWMHLTQFDSSQILRPREQELEGIEEE
eukprot:s4618_g1.t1